VYPLTRDERSHTTRHACTGFTSCNRMTILHEPLCESA